MDIYVNALIEYRDEVLKTTSIERILWISNDREIVIVFRIDDKVKTPFPEMKQYLEITELLETPFALLLDIDPYAEYNTPSVGYLEKHKKIRDEKWDLIAKYVDYEPYIYEEERLKEIVKEIKRESGKQSKRIYGVLRQYWKGGKTKNSLLPTYLNSGGRGKPKQLKGNKVGRPSKKSIFLGKKGEGVNVLESDKKILYKKQKIYSVSEFILLIVTEMLPFLR